MRRTRLQNIAPVSGPITCNVFFTRDFKDLLFLVFCVLFLLLFVETFYLLSFSTFCTVFAVVFNVILNEERVTRRRKKRIKKG